MATTEITDAPALGEHGEPCRNCGAPLAADQRYCLNCGQRRSGPRVPFEKTLMELDEQARPEPAPATQPAGAPPSRREWAPLVAIGGLAALGIMLILGVLIGKSASDDSGSNASRPVIQVGGGPATASTAGNSGNGSEAVSNTTFKSDWPAGKTGYTVEVGTLPKQGTTGADVTSAKSDVATKGAPNVGALDSDQFASLPPGKYVIYSGVYDSKAEATKALGELKGKFPNAQVIKVSTSGGSSGPTSSSATDLVQHANTDTTVTASDKALRDLNQQSGENYEKTIQHLPDTIKTEGRPPPKDNQASGAGSPTTVIK
jgi:hypothetical protein